MRFTGKMTDNIGVDDAADLFAVKEAVVTDTSVLIDWEPERETLGTGSLKAKSSDAVTYVGAFGYRKCPSVEYRTELKRYDAKDGSIVLIGSYLDDDRHELSWIFRLSPLAEQASVSRSKAISSP